MTPDEAMPVVGIVGTGLMGTSAAHRLVSLGTPVVVANRTRERARALAGRYGVDFSSTFRELAERSSVVLVLTSGEDGTRDALLDADGVLAGVRPGTPIVLSSTVSPELVDELASAAHSAQAVLVDAPISGRPTELAAGDVSFLVGAGDEELESVREILSILGRVVHVGPVGSGAAMKLAINVVVFALVGGLAESLALATRAGVSPAIAYEALQSSAIGSPFVDLRRSHFVEDSAPVQFSMEAARENLELIDRTAKSYGLHLVQTEANARAMATAVAAGMGHADVTAMLKLLTSGVDSPTP